MNFSDSEDCCINFNKRRIFQLQKTLHEADLVFVNTCSIREKAEQTVRKRLELYNSIKRDKEIQRNDSGSFGLYGRET